MEQNTPATDCIFCKIINGTIPCHKIYESKHSLAFLDIYPHTKGHTVIIPKQHIELAEEANESILSNIMHDIQSTMNIINKTLHPAGFNVGWNNGKTAGQVVPHMHIHIFPRYENDGGESFHAIIKNPGPTPVAEIAKLFPK